MLLISWLREVCRGRVNVHSSRSCRSVQAARSFADVQILESRRLLTDLTAAVTNAGVLVVTDPSNAATNVVTLQYHLTNGQTPTMDFFLTGSGLTTINGQTDFDVTANLASFSTISVLTGNNNDTIHIDTTNQGFSNISGGITLSGSSPSAGVFVSATGNNTYDFDSTNLIGNVVVDDLTGAGAQDKLDFSASFGVRLNLGITSIQQVNTGDSNLNLSLTSNTVSSNINVVGGAASNMLTAGSGNDILDVSSSSGTNILTAGNSGNDVLKGGSGTNTYKFGDAVGVSLDTIVPGTGTGINILDFSLVTSSLAAPQQVNLATNGGVNDPTDTLWLASATSRRVYVVNGSDANAFQLVIGSKNAGGANQLTAGAGPSVILDVSGSSGTNTLTAGNSGNDLLKGGSGTNTYKFGDAVGVSLDTIAPGTGINILDFSHVTSSFAAPQQVNLATSGGVNDPTDTLWLASATKRRVYVDNGSDANAFQLVIGSNNASGANQLTAGAGPNVTLDVSGSSGTNTLTAGNSGIEELKGGSGTNTYRFGDAVGVSLNAIVPGTGTNALDFSHVTSSLAAPLQVNLATPGGVNDPADNLWLASATSRRVYVFNGSDTNAFQLVIGSNTAGGANQLTAGAGLNVTLDTSGSSGTNTLTAGFTGNEVLKGGSEANTFRFGDAVSISHDTIAPGKGANTLDFSHVTSSVATPLQVNLATSGGMIDPTDTLWLASITNRRVYVANSNAANAIQLVIGSSNAGGANQLTGGAAPNVTLDVTGSSGTNTLTAGNAGNEVLKGGSGPNTYKFGDAASISLDTIVPGTGANTLNFSNVTSSVAVPLQVNLATSGGVNDPTDSLWLASITNRRVYVGNGGDTNAFQLVIGSANAGGANQLTGGSGPGVTLDVSGSSGTNTLTAGNSGTEELKGGLGATTYKFGNAVGISLNAIVPGTGPNTLDFSGVTSSAAAPLQVNLATSGGVNDLGDTLWLASATNRRVYVFNGTDTNAFQRVYGSTNAGGQNRLTAGTGSNVTLDASGYAAVNDLTAGTGTDTLIGGAGNNAFTTGTGLDQMIGANGDANTFVFLDHASSVILTPSGTGYNALDFRNVSSTPKVDLTAKQIIAEYGTTVVSTSATYQGGLFQAVFYPS